MQLQNSFPERPPLPHVPLQAAHSATKRSRVGFETDNFCVSSMAAESGDSKIARTSNVSALRTSKPCSNASFGSSLPFLLSVGSTTTWRPLPGSPLEKVNFERRSHRLLQLRTRIGTRREQWRRSSKAHTSSAVRGTSRRAPPSPPPHSSAFCAEGTTRTFCGAGEGETRATAQAGKRTSKSNKALRRRRAGRDCIGVASDIEHAVLFPRIRR